MGLHNLIRLIKKDIKMQSLVDIYHSSMYIYSFVDVC